MRMKILTEALKVLDRRSMNPTVKAILEEESINGMVMSNRLRYAIIGLFLLNLLIFWEDPGTPVSLIIIGIFSLATVIHTYLLKQHQFEKAEIYNYFVLVLDFLLILVLILSYTQAAGRGNYSFAVKNNTFWLVLPLLLLQLPQLKIKLIWLSFLVILAVQYSFVGLMLSDNPVFTKDWYENLMSDKVNLADALINRLMIISGVGMILSYSIYRAIFMVRRLGEVQHQKSMLSRYFSPQIVDEITTNPDNFRGQQQKVTILFTDIRDFTKFSEKVTPDKLVAFLSEFRERMSSVILEMGGVVDKFIGDAIMANFGTPTPADNPGEDSLNAVKAGLKMKEQLALLNQEREKQGFAPIKIGIGIHTGDVIAGSIGQGQLLEYTVIGDTVNTASRIESLCKELEVDFIISREVYEDLNEAIAVKPLPPTLVKGKYKPLEIYQVLSQT